MLRVAVWDSALLLGEVFPTSRVPARWADFQRLDRYEAWTCLVPGSTPEDPKVDRDAEGRLRWVWRRDGLPVDAKELLQALEHFPAIYRPRSRDLYQVDAIPVLGTGKRDLGRLATTRSMSTRASESSWHGAP